MNKEHTIRLLELIQKHYDNQANYLEALKDLSMELFRDTIFDTMDVFTYGVMLYHTLHVDGVRMEVR